MLFKKTRKTQDIDLEEMNDIIRNNNNNVVLLDVRSPQEFKEGHIRNAINIPLYEINIRLPRIIKDKSRIIIVYCLSGKRSKKAAIYIDKCGYKNVYNLRNGIE